MYSSPNIVMVTKSRSIRWAGHVECMGRGQVLTGFWLGGPKGRDHWKDLGVAGRIILNIKMELWERGIDMANWIRLDQHTVQCRAFVNTVMNLRVP
jgi:hypothetical protein